MRCDEVTRELSAPTGRLDSAELAGHLGACPRCAAWAEDAEQFNRLWNATRPADPPADAFDRIWGHVQAAALETAAAPATIPMPTASPARARGGRLRLTVSLLASAAAAALLIAVTIAARKGDRPQPDLVLNNEAETRPTEHRPRLHFVGFSRVVEAVPGRTTFIQLGGESVCGEPVCVTQRDQVDVSPTETVAAENDILSFMESQDPVENDVLNFTESQGSL